MSTYRYSLLAILAAALLVAACQPPILSSPAQESATGPTRVVVGLGYIPSVQFAPFYVAQSKGYFAQEGLEVQFQHGFETDFLKLTGTDEIPFAVGSGEQVILGRSQGLPLTYVLRWSRKVPVVVFALEEEGLTQPTDLEGRRVGIPGLFGASLVAWKALVYATGLD
ncbi:MAG: ABC transporter substrate-binding protein, partial [Caldilineales bacterium]|nr:ABC transporter substrate-binding protein [Caldilineales bacterium]